MVLTGRYTFRKLAILVLSSALLVACSDSDSESDVMSEPSLSKKKDPLSTPVSNVILACAKKENGQLRIVENHSECHPSEDPVSWNQAGPTGPAGPQGPQGSAGQCSDCKPLQYQFVGFSQQNTQGTTGVLQLTTYCQASYPNSRICTTEEVVKSVTFPAVTSSSPANPTAAGWVVPTAIAGRGATIGFDITTGHQTDVEGLTCGGWSGTATIPSSGGGTGLTVTDRGQFKVTPCSSSFKVACCAPVTNTEVKAVPRLLK